MTKKNSIFRGVLNWNFAMLLGLATWVGCTPQAPTPKPNGPAAAFRSTLEENKDFTVNFDGSRSTGTGLTYEWDWDDDSPDVVTASTTVSHTFPAGGAYEIGLRVTDSQKRTHKIKKTILVPFKDNQPEHNMPGIKYSWNVARFPLPYRMADTLTSSEMLAVQQMAKVWEDGAWNIDFFNINSQPVPNKEKAGWVEYLGDGEMGVYTHEKWFPDLPSNYLAIASYWGYRWNAGTPEERFEIIEGDIIFNYKHHSFTTSDFNPFVHDFHSVLLHEMGHILGLKHEETSEKSVMDPGLEVGFKNRDLEQIDLEYIQELYPDGPEALAGGEQEDQVPEGNDAPVKVRGYIGLKADGTEGKFEEVIPVGKGPGEVF